MQEYNPIIVGGNTRIPARLFGELLAKEAGVTVVDTPERSLHAAVAPAPGMMEQGYRVVRKASKSKRKAQKASRRKNRK